VKAQQLQQHPAWVTDLAVIPPLLHQGASGVAPARRPAVVTRPAVGGALVGEDVLQLLCGAHREQSREEA